MLLEEQMLFSLSAFIAYLLYKKKRNAISRIGVEFSDDLVIRETLITSTFVLTCDSHERKYPEHDYADWMRSVSLSTRPLHGEGTFDAEPRPVLPRPLHC
jgi:hypothetical protein